MKTMEHLIKKLALLYRVISMSGLFVFACLNMGYAQTPCFSVDFNSDKTKACKGDTVKFSVFITNNGGSNCNNYTVKFWKTGATTPLKTLTGTMTTYNYSYIASGDMADFSVYTEVLVTGSGCTPSGCNTTVISPAISIDLTIAAQIIPASPVIECGNSSILLTAQNQLDPSGNYTYTWHMLNSSETQTGKTLTANTMGTYIVAITGNGNTCSSTDTVTVGNSMQLSVAIETDPSNGTFCQGDSISLTASAGTNYQYAWSTGSTQQSIKVSETGSYSVTVTIASSACTGTASRSVTKLLKPLLGDYEAVYSVKSGESKTIIFLPPGGVTVGWQLLDLANVSSLTQTSGTGSFTKTYTSGDPRAPGQVRYVVEAKSSSPQSCPGETDTIVVLVIPADTTGAPFIPEVVSPNNDGNNDYWNVLFPNEDASNHRVVVYNRSGGMVYEKDSMIEAWSPAACPDGVYYYLITQKDGGRQYKGALTIIGGNP